MRRDPSPVLVGDLDGFALTAVDHDWSVGRGPRVEGPIGALLLLLTGRYAAAGELTGPGVPDLTARLSSSPG